MEQKNRMRLDQLFIQKPTNILNIYCTAGYPKLDSTIGIMQQLENNGADIIELGIPYSDPLADGETIQQSSSVALQNGMSIEVLFEQLKDFRNTIHVPVILMGYMNPILQYGFEKFCAKAAQLGIDGFILPDLPVYEFKATYAEILKKHNLHFIFLITPETSEERILLLDSLSSGFLYAVSSSSTTGAHKNLSDVKIFLNKLNQLSLKNPILVGFGIKDKAGFDFICENAAGAIIGSAFIKALSPDGMEAEQVQNFMQSILK